VERGGTVMHGATMNTPTLSVRIPLGLRDQLEQIAEQDRRPLSNLVRLALEDYASEQRRGERSHRGHHRAA
jgi:predicted transcriptional regulator